MSISFNGYTIAPYADLMGANLSGADLTGADLSGIDFSNARLSNVKFNSADLSGTNFNGAILDNIDLTDANLFGAKFVNLSSQPSLPAGYIYKNGDVYGPKLDLTNNSFSELSDLPADVSLDLTGSNISGNANVEG